MAASLMWRGVAKVGLAGAEIDQVGALGAQFGGLGGNGHGGGDFNAANAVGKDFGGSGDGHDVSIFTDFERRANLPRGTR